MAEFKVNPRQVSTPQTDLPSTNVYGRLSQALGGISEKVMGVGTAINVEQQALQGAKDRMEGGPREQLAPGITKATQSYNQAFAKMDESLIVSDTTTALSATLVESMKPENLSQPGNVERYQEISQSIIKGALENSLEVNRPEIALKLNQQAANSTIRLGSMQADYDFKVATSQAAVTNSQLIESIYNNDLSGNTELADEDMQTFEENTEAQMQLGMLLPEEKYKYDAQLKQARINANLERVFNEQESEENRALFIYNLQNGHDSLSLTPSEREAASQHIASVNAKQIRAQSAVSSIGYDRLDQTLSFRPEEFPSIESLRTAVVKSAQDGFPLTMAQSMDLENTWLKMRAKENQVMVRNAEVRKILPTSDAANLTNDELDDYFLETVKEQKEQVANIAQSNLPEKNKILDVANDWQIEAAVAATSKYKPINAFTKKVTAKLYGGTTQEKLEVLETFSYLERTNPVALNGFNATDKALVQDILNRMEATSVPAEQVIQESFEQIVNVRESVKTERENSLVRFKREHPNYIDKLTKDIYGDKLKGMLGATEVTMRNAVSKEFDTYYLLKGDEKLAAQIATKNMKFKAAPSRFGSPAGIPMWNPVEKLPFYGFGNTVDNQLTRNLQAIVNISAKNTDETAPKITWSSKMGAPPKSWTERDKMLGDYSKNGWWLNIDGVDRQVYLVSPSLNQSTAAGYNGPVYSLYYDRNGIPTQLTTLGPTTMQFVSPNKDVPGIYDALQKEQADAQITEAAQRKFNLDRDIDLSGLGNSKNLTGSGFDYPQVNIQSSKLNKEDFKKYLQQFKEDIPKGIQAEKLKRAQSKADKKLEEKLNG